MFHVLLVSHGNLAGVLVKSAEMIVGSQDRGVLGIGIDTGQSTEEFREEVKRFILNSDQAGGTLILTDILSGSPFLTSVQVFRELCGKVPVEIVTGANLPMLIEVLNCREHCGLAEAKKIALTEGVDGIRDFTLEMRKKSEPEQTE